MGTTVRSKTKKPSKDQTETMNFSEVKTVYNDFECNELITKGWKILHAGVSHVDSNGFNAKNTFIMGNPK